MLPSDQNATDQPKTNADVLQTPQQPRQGSGSSGLSSIESCNFLFPIILYMVQVCLIAVAEERSDVLWHIGMWYVFPAALFAYRYWRASLNYHVWADIPLTKIGELSPGMVKVEGRTRRLLDLTIPDTDKKVVYYKSEKYVGPEGEGVMAEATDSADNPFLLVDETGSVMVDPREAIVGCTESIEVDAPPENRQIVVYSVSYIPEDQPMTVVGFAHPPDDEQGDEIPGRLVIGQSPSGNQPHTITTESPVNYIYFRLYLALIIHVGLTLLTLVPLYIHYRVWQCF